MNDAVNSGGGNQDVIQLFGYSQDARTAADSFFGGTFNVYFPFDYWSSEQFPAAVDLILASFSIFQFSATSPSLQFTGVLNQDWSFSCLRQP